MFNHNILLNQYNLLQNKVIEIGRHHLDDTYYVDFFEIFDDSVGVYFKKFKSDDVLFITFTWNEINNSIEQLNHKFK